MKGGKMIKIEDYAIFKEQITVLKELSKDNSVKELPCYMTEIKAAAVDFDKVKTKYVNELGLSEEAATSVDALINIMEHLTMIEFKNGNMKGEKRKVKDKIRDSLMIFCDITGKNISETRQSMDFILVYNLEKNPLPNQLTKGIVQESKSRTAIGKHFLQKGGQEYILFDLERFKKLYFREVHTYSQKEFEQYITGKLVVKS